MTITTDQAIALAREVGCLVRNGEHCFDDEELTAFANKVRTQTLLEAAEVCDKHPSDPNDPSFNDDFNMACGELYQKLRKMAGVE